MQADQGKIPSWKHTGRHWCPNEVQGVKSVRPLALKCREDASLACLLAVLSIFNRPVLGRLWLSQRVSWLVLLLPDQSKFLMSVGVASPRSGRCSLRAVCRYTVCTGCEQCEGIPHGTTAQHTRTGEGNALPSIGRRANYERTWLARPWRWSSGARNCLLFYTII